MVILIKYISYVRIYDRKTITVFMPDRIPSLKNGRVLVKKRVDSLAPQHILVTRD